MNKEKQASNEKEVYDYIEYNAGNAGYTDRVYEEHMAHTKVGSKRPLLNFLYIISV